MSASTTQPRRAKYRAVFQCDIDQPPEPCEKTISGCGPGKDGASLPASIRKRPPLTSCFGGLVGYPMKLGGPCASSTLRSGSRLKPACDVGAAAIDPVPPSVKTRHPCAPTGAMTAVHYGIVFSAFSGRWEPASHRFAITGLVDLRQHLGMRLLLLRIARNTDRTRARPSINGSCRQVNRAR